MCGKDEFTCVTPGLAFYVMIGTIFESHGWNTFGMVGTSFYNHDSHMGSQENGNKTCGLDTWHDMAEKENVMIVTLF